MFRPLFLDGIDNDFIINKYVPTGTFYRPAVSPFNPLGGTSQFLTCFENDPRQTELNEPYMRGEASDADATNSYIKYINPVIQNINAAVPGGLLPELPVPIAGTGVNVHKNGLVIIL